MPFDHPKRIVPDAVHDCSARQALLDETAERLGAERDEALWGQAVTRVEHAAGRWWAHNEEYASVIRFCPWCGADLQRETPA